MQQNNPQGTITWFEFPEIHPSIADHQSNGLIKRSANVLVWGKGGWTQQTYYNHTTGTWFAQDQLPFTITHFAYINYP